MSVLSLPRALWTPFQEKSYELDQLKRRAYKLMGDFNCVVFEYRDWFKNRNQAFLNAVKAVQAHAPDLVPYNISTLDDFRRLYTTACRLEKTGFCFRGRQIIEEFLGFWKELLRLKELLDNELMPEVLGFSATVGRFRDPELRLQVDNLHAEFCDKCLESFDFSAVNNVRDNLFTYSLTVADQRFLGLVGFIPYLLDYATRTCFLIGKLFIERL